MNPGAGGPVRLAAAPAPSAPPGYSESGTWRGFWNQVGPPDTGHGPGDYSDDDLPGSTGLTEPMPMISPGLPTAPTAVPAARPAGPAAPPRPGARATARHPGVRAAVGRRPDRPARARATGAPGRTAAAGPAARARARRGTPGARPGPHRRFPPGSDPARPRPRQHRTRWGAAYPIVLAGTAAGLAYLWRGPQNVRGGVLAVAVTLLLAAAARLVLPERRAGLLVSRRRFADVAAFSILGLALLVAGLVLPAQG